jgi:hypothetical protein
MEWIATLSYINFYHDETSRCLFDDIRVMKYNFFKLPAGRAPFGEIDDHRFLLDYRLLKDLLRIGMPSKSARSLSRIVVIFDSSLRWFEACSCKPPPRDLLPSSFMQPRGTLIPDYLSRFPTSIRSQGQLIRPLCKPSLLENGYRSRYQSSRLTETI